MKQLNSTDIVVDAKAVFVKSLKDETGYPYNLNDTQVTRMIYFFGARKLATRAMTKGTLRTESFMAVEVQVIESMFEWFGFKPKLKSEWKAAYNGVTNRFKLILDFLRKRPAFVTRQIYNALMTAGYTNVVKNVIPVVDEHGNQTLRLAESTNPNNPPVPLGKMDAILYEIQNVGLDKMMLILQSITPADIKKASLGNKSKAVRDIYSMIHMARQANKNPNMTLIGINVNTSSPNEKLKGYGAYITKNRDG